MSDSPEGLSPLQTTLTDEQHVILKLLLDTFNEYRSWPLWQFVEQKCDDAGFDGATVLATLPIVGSKQGFYGLNYGLTWTQGTLGASHQPGDPIGLTVAGLYRAGADEYVRVFLLVLSTACQKLRNFVPNPQQAVTLELTSAEVYAELRDDDKTRLAPQELYALLEHEPAMWSGGRGMTAEGEWRWEVTRPIRRYEEVQTIDDYIEAITALTEEHAQQVAQTVPLAGIHSSLAAKGMGLNLSEWSLADNSDLSPDIPLLGSGIDFELWEFVRPLVDEGRWEQVAREAAAFVETRARDWTGSKKDVLDLMSEILKPDNSSGPPPKDLAIESAALEGWHLFARGFFMAIRNHVMHNSVGVQEQLQYGLGALGAASLLIRQIRTVVESQTVDGDPTDSSSQQSAQ